MPAACALTASAKPGHLARKSSSISRQRRRTSGPERIRVGPPVELALGNRRRQIGDRKQRRAARQRLVG